MVLKLYPIVQQRLNNNIADEIIPSLWQNNLDKLPQGHYCYSIYFNYATNYQADYDFAIASEVVSETDIPVIEIEDLSCYEVFRCKVDEIYQTWQLIWKKEQQGLLKRAYSVDFEKHHPDGLVEIYIAVEPHC
ncbi:MAG: GyrI-like domain-containing protein [Haemophilus parainfluenzae]|jgi:raw score 4.89|uniref:GyrI-like domain-containing protein n=1 Tax=Haemophilus TaxID=724 RepID=UPI0018A443C8|nr:GyrI-like domain-containing protein [Haemophilus parainfluenzae]QOR19158.1 AraC family transcriptional regulator [Haemophilus parainfluenzae]QOR20958.1 AraC family transcriptional regulator [Haemophilus parainfluenzae]QOR22566.1 AraC family transcriptional regulator [Haemophilus parainfluenzae]